MGEDTVKRDQPDGLDDGRLTRLEEAVTVGFRDQAASLTSLGGRVGSIEGRVVSIEGRVVSIDGRMGSIEGRMGSIEGRMGSLEDQMQALSAKFDVSTDAIQDSIKTVLERVGGVSEQLERSMKSTRQRHSADQRLTRLVLRDHNRRIQALEESGSK